MQSLYQVLMTHTHNTAVSVASELVSTVIQFLLTTVALKLRFKLHVQESGFYLSAFISLEIKGDKTDSSCNLTSSPLQPKLPPVK